MSKYSALTAFLEQRPEEDTTLSFEEIDGLIAGLCQTARQDRTWWANTYASPEGASWMTAGWKVRSVDLAAGVAQFQRVADGPLPDTRLLRANGKERMGTASHNREKERAGGPRSTEARLRDFLDGQPSGRQQIALKFTEVGHIRGKPLPLTARTDRTWWANLENPNGSPWPSERWMVQGVYLTAQIVVFRRKDADPANAIPRQVRGLLEGTPPPLLLTGSVLLEWLRVSRRVGWPFEATVLYERSGMALDSLGERDRSEADEIYAHCKREVSLHQKGR